MQSVYIRCPKCTWEPDETCIWVCAVCKTRWNTFDTHAKCPTCGELYENTQCRRSKGGCGLFSAHKQWYVDYIEPKKASGVPRFWKKEIGYPVTSTDKIWIELSLPWIVSQFETLNLRSPKTIIPPDIYAKYEFKNSEDDAWFLLGEIGRILDIDTSEIKLVFVAAESPEMPEEELTAIALASTGEEESKWNFEPVPNVYWLKLNQLYDVDELIVALAQKLLRRKILMELEAHSTNDCIVALAAIAFGFGIFMANTYFKFSRWQKGNSKGWRMQRQAYPPEQVIAYAMAWLAYYRDEDVSWKQYFNKTMLKYFDQSYTYIGQNKAECNLPN